MRMKSIYTTVISVCAIITFWGCVGPVTSSGVFSENEGLINDVEANRHHHHHHHHDFDFLMFTQIWPITGCLTWEDSGYSHKCTIDDTKKDWTIHGLWPTKRGQVGPSYCNDSYEFDPRMVKDLLVELEDKWTNVHKGNEFEFWKHEWDKHGTCAMQLPETHNEYLYFKKALELHYKYDVTKMLAEAGIVSGKAYAPDEVIGALSVALSPEHGPYIRPAVQCSYDRNFDHRLFYEIIICLDKDFNTIGCEETAAGIYGKCSHNTMIYPNSIATLGTANDASTEIQIEESMDSSEMLDSDNSEVQKKSVPDCGGTDDKPDFDFLMLSQLWPITSCLTWEDSGEEHSCTIDDSANLWTIHGVWPTRADTVGPLYCNHSAKFDPDKIKDLIPQLEEEWTDVRDTSDRYSFWRHEWEKHGTCAMKLPEFANEFKYFRTALDLYGRWNASRIMEMAGIEPGNQYYAKDILKAMSKLFHPDKRIVPAINCAHDKGFSNNMLYEFIICIDKNFEPTSCSEISGGLYGSCHNRLITFPKTIHISWWRKNLVWVMFPLGVAMMVMACCLIHYMFFGRRRRGYARIPRPDIPRPDGPTEPVCA